MRQVIGKTQTIDVEGLKSSLLRQRTTIPCFRLPLTQQQAAAALTAAYIAEVERRRMAFQSNKDVAALVEAMGSALTEERPKLGILLCGTPGNGKTTALYALQSVVNWLGDMKAFEEKTVLPIIDAKDMARQAKDFGWFDGLRSRYLLGLEDIGREPTEVMDFGNVINPIADVLEYRYQNMLPTYITSNLTPKQLLEKYGKRVVDRFNEMFEVIILKNGSYRQEFAQQSANAKTLTK